MASTIRMARKPLSPSTPITALLVVFSILLGLSGSGAAIGAWQAWRSADYREVPGTVLEVGVSRSERRGSKATPQGERSSYLHVRYRYRVDGVDYEGDRLQPGTFGMTSADSLKRFGGRFAEGAEVAVYVDPADPRTAVLVRGWSSVTTLLCVLSGFFGAAVLVLRPLRRAMLAPARPAARR